VAYAFAAAHPEAVRRLVILDVVIPGDGTQTVSQGRWHHYFHQALDLPEALTHGRERIYLSFFYRNWGYRPNAITEVDIDEYLRTYTQPGAMRAGFNYYRALPQDIKDNSEIVARFKLPMPVLGFGPTGGRARGQLVYESLRAVAKNVHFERVEECGHWIAEEQPQFLSERLLTFFYEDYEQ
jgi:pimeloyl-ACP methyl ester carboxylesterase